MLFKICTKCSTEKSVVSFPKNSKGKYKTGQICKECNAKITAKYRETNYNKVYANKYSISELEVKTLLEKEVCDICGKYPSDKRRHAIDHCHTTNTVRGLLCDTCNKGLGLFYDNPELLQKAIDYLRGKYGVGISREKGKKNE